MAVLNTIPYIHPLISDNAGENYWFNGCARYAMEGAAIRDGRASRIDIPARALGEWPLPSGQYDHALNTVGIPDGAQLFGLFTENYQQLGHPDAPPGLAPAASLPELTEGKYCVFSAGAFRYVAVMHSGPVSVTVPGYDCGALASYDLFAGITGDNFAQIWPYRDGLRGRAASEYQLSREFVERMFHEVGYAVEYVAEAAASGDSAALVRKLTECVDSGVPVIVATRDDRDGFYTRGCDCVVVGYDDGGETLLTLRHEQIIPARRTLDEMLAGHDWIFVGARMHDADLARVYRDAVLRLPELLTTRTKDYVFGAEAFREWARAVEKCAYTANDFTDGAFTDGAWWAYTNYICILATNGSHCSPFLERAMALNPDFAFLSEISSLYRKTADMWNKDENCLEALGGGFNVTLETLRDSERRERIVAKIREFADITDEVVRVLKANL